eukprot:Pgem_evm1s2856
MISYFLILVIFLSRRIFAFSFCTCGLIEDINVCPNYNYPFECVSEKEMKQFEKHVVMNKHLRNSASLFRYSNFSVNNDAGENNEELDEAFEDIEIRMAMAMDKIETEIETDQKKAIPVIRLYTNNLLPSSQYKEPFAGYVDVNVKTGKIESIENKQNLLLAKKEAEELGYSFFSL